jgi:hypothetical protein
LLCGQVADRASQEGKYRRGAAGDGLFGKNATGAYYPTGEERAENISKCAAGNE